MMGLIMKNCGALLVLLLCLSEVGAQGETVPTMEQRMKSLELRMEDMAKQNEEMAAKWSASEEKVSDLQTRLNASENQVLELKKESEGTPSKADMWREVTGVRDKLHSVAMSVVNLRERLAVSNHDVQDLTQKNEETAAKLSASEEKVSDLQTRLNASENQVLDLKEESEALQNDVSTLKTENSALKNAVSALETDVSALKTQNSVLQNDASTLKTENSALKNAVSALENGVSALENHVSALKTQNSDLTSKVTTQQRETEAQLTTFNNDLGNLKRDVGPKVGFSASLASGAGGPGSSVTIVFKHVFINNGNAYSPSTGVFTAPQKGAYYFTFTAFGGASPSYRIGANLMKNGQRQVSTLKEKGQSWDSTSQSVILDLNAGDTVNVMTRGSDYQVYDNSEHFTTFSGFLLFPL